MAETVKAPQPSGPAFTRINGADIWVTLTREEKETIGAIAVELVVARRLSRRVFEDQLGDVLDRAAGAGITLLLQLLEHEVSVVLPDGALEAEDGITPVVPGLLGGICRKCGCTQDDACPAGCGWAAEDLCITCAEGPTHG